MLAPPSSQRFFKGQGVVADEYIATKVTKSGPAHRLVRIHQNPDQANLLEDLNKDLGLGVIITWGETVFVDEVTCAEENIANGSVCIKTKLKTPSWIRVWFSIDRSQIPGEILEDHFDGDRGNDTIEDNGDVNPSD
ncbi:hypothetical protein Tco_0064877 [Tanacetum coccineum]